MDINLQYEPKQLKKELIAVGKKLNLKQKTCIAMQEGLAYTTAHRYFSGNIGFYAVAVALINKGNNILNASKDDC